MPFLEDSSKTLPHKADWKEVSWIWLLGRKIQTIRVRCCSFLAWTAAIGNLVIPSYSKTKWGRIKIEQNRKKGHQPQLGSWSHRVQWKSAEMEPYTQQSGTTTTCLRHSFLKMNFPLHRDKLSAPHLPLEQCFSKCGPQATFIGITWDDGAY